MTAGGQLGHDAHYLVTTARLFGWRTVWEPDGRALMRRDAWMVEAFFTGDGTFRHGQVTSPGLSGVEMSMCEVIDVLEQHGTVAPDAG